jgi:hypothetical protein
MAAMAPGALRLDNFERPPGPAVPPLPSRMPWFQKTWEKPWKNIGNHRNTMGKSEKHWENHRKIV